ncbi:MAG: DUF1013 domain-containing protein [Alphaproteobacteria bacterium]
MTQTPLMPKATAVWLVDNTSLTFDQIADFCGLHMLEVKGIADGDVAHGIKGMDPITSGQLTRDEIARAQNDQNYRLKLAKSKVAMPEVKTKRSPKYTPLSRRQDRPNAILWLLKHHPELRDAQIMRIVGTTKSTIASIRDRTHWNSANLQPNDPVALGICSQIDLDAEVRRAARRAEQERRDVEKEAGGPIEPVGTLLPVEETTASTSVLLRKDDQVSHDHTEEADDKSDRALTVEDVFGKQEEPGQS